MLTLTRHRAEMGVINNRIEKHGDDSVTAFDIPVTLLLDPDQFDELLGDGHHERWFIRKGRTHEPACPDIESFRLKNDYDQASVTLHFDRIDVEFDGARLKDLTLAPVQGGETELWFKLQVRPQNKHITRLLDGQNCELQISLSDAQVAQKARRSQQELPLETNGKGGNEQPDSANA